MAIQSHVLCGFRWKRFVLQFWRHLLRTAIFHHRTILPGTLAAFRWTEWTTVDFFQGKNQVVPATTPVKLLPGCQLSAKYKLLSFLTSSHTQCTCLYLHASHATVYIVQTGTVTTPLNLSLRSMHVGTQINVVIIASLYMQQMPCNAEGFNWALESSSYVCIGASCYIDRGKLKRINTNNYYHSE